MFEILNETGIEFELSRIFWNENDDGYFVLIPSQIFDKQSVAYQRF